MEDGWMTADELIRAVGDEAGVTPGLLVQWHKLDLLPRPQRERRQHGRGFDSRGYPPGTLRQLKALLLLRRDTDDTHTLRVMLWIAGYPVPLQKVKESLCTALKRGFSPLLDIALPADADEDAIWEWADTIGRTIANERPRTKMTQVLHRRFAEAEDLISGVTALAALAQGEELIVSPTGAELPEDGLPLSESMDRVIGIPPRPDEEASKDWEEISTQGLFNAYALYKALNGVEDAGLASLRGPALMLGLGISGMIQHGVTLADLMSGRQIESYTPSRETAGHVAMTIAALLLARGGGLASNAEQFVALSDEAAKEILSASPDEPS
jgi:hypothetical protein